MNCIYPKNRLVDIVTGEIVGYIFTDNDYSVAVTESKAKELDFECSDILEYMDIPNIEVVSYQNRYGVVSTSLMRLHEFETVEFERLADTIAVYGYVFEKNKFISLDNEYAIKRILNGGE